MLLRIASRMLHAIGDVELEVRLGARNVRYTYFPSAWLSGWSLLVGATAKVVSFCSSNVVMIFRTTRQRCGAGGNLSLWTCSRALGAAAPCLRPTCKPSCLATSPCGLNAAAGAFRKGVVGRWAAVRHVFSATGNASGWRRAQAGRRSVAISPTHRSQPTLGGGGAWASANSSKSTLIHSDLERARDLGSGCGPNPIGSDL